MASSTEYKSTDEQPDSEGVHTNIYIYIYIYTYAHIYIYI